MRPAPYESAALPTELSRLADLAGPKGLQPDITATTTPRRESVAGTEYHAGEAPQLTAHSGGLSERHEALLIAWHSAPVELGMHPVFWSEIGRESDRLAGRSVTRRGRGRGLLSERPVGLADEPKNTKERTADEQADNQPNRGADDAGALVPDGATSQRAAGGDGASRVGNQEEQPADSSRNQRQVDQEPHPPTFAAHSTTAQLDARAGER